MKKNKILFNFLYILFICVIFFGCDKVLAAKKLVCLYKGAGVWYGRDDPSTMVVQDENGHITIWEHLVDDIYTTDINSKWWTINDKIKINYEDNLIEGYLTDCPKYIHYDGDDQIKKEIFLRKEDGSGVDQELYSSSENGTLPDEIDPKNYRSAFGDGESWVNSLEYVGQFDKKCTYEVKETKYYDIDNNGNHKLLDYEPEAKVEGSPATKFSDYTIDLIFNENQYFLQVRSTGNHMTKSYLNRVFFSRSDFEEDCPKNIYGYTIMEARISAVPWPFVATRPGMVNTLFDLTEINTNNEYFNDHSRPLTYEGGYFKFAKFELYHTEYSPNFSIDNKQDIVIPSVDECESLLGDPVEPQTPAWYLVKVFDVLKYVAIILLVVLSILDFVTATAAQNEDEMKKATSKVIKRALLCVLIFLLPTLIEFILKYMADRAIDLCGID